jgi:hypothetical protein
MTVSGDKVVFSERYAMKKAINIARTMDEIEKSIPRSAPSAIPAKAEWDMAFEKKDIFRKTTKHPTKGQSIPAIIEANKAL